MSRYKTAAATKAQHDVQDSGPGGARWQGGAPELEPLPSTFKVNLPPTGPQLGCQNPPKSLKNRCQDALYFAVYFLIDYWSIFAPNLDLLDLKKRCFPLEKSCFLKNCFSKLTSIFDPILDSTLLDFGIPNPPKSFQKSITRGTKHLINFGIDL